MPKKSGIRWDKIEIEWLAGLRPVTDIASQYGITEGAIRAYAKKHQWNRNDVPREVVKSTKRKVRQTIATKIVADFHIIITETQQKRLTKLSDLFDKLNDELVAQMNDLDEFKRLGEIIDLGNNDKLRELFFKIIDSPQRIDSAKKLSDVLKNLIECERKVYGIQALEDKAEKNVNLNVTINERDDYIDSYVIKTIEKLNERRRESTIIDAS